MIHFEYCWKTDNYCQQMFRNTEYVYVAIHVATKQ